MPMGFTLQLVQDLVEVEAGATTPVTIVATNRGETAERFELELEGLDQEWKAIPVPVFTAEPGESHTERVFIKPPRTSESLAGNYPFVVNVRSLESGEQKSAQGVVRLKAYNHLTMEIDPKKGAVSPTVKRNTFTVTLVNLGNTPHTVQMAGSDPEDACTYDFEQEQVALGPGQQKEVEVTVRPSEKPMFASGHLIGFSIAARSTDAPNVVATAQAQLEQRSLISPATLVLGFLLAIIVATWLLMMPKPPVVQLTVNPMRGVAGSVVTLSWVARDANHVIITESSNSGQVETVYDGVELSKTITRNLDKDPGTETFVANVYKDSHQGQPDRKTVVLDAPPPIVRPSILSFQASSKAVKLGTSVIFTWRTENADTVVLSPSSTPIRADLETFSVTPDHVGEQDFRLVAISPDGHESVRSKPIRINVFQESKASIIAFGASPNPVREEAGSSVTVSWQVTDAVRVELKQSSGDTQVVASVGTQTFQVSGKTSYTIKAYDAQAVAVTKTIVVPYIKAPVPTPPPPIDGPPTTSTSGQGGDTTVTTGGGTGTTTSGGATSGGATTGTTGNVRGRS